ncbi:MAG TPA: RDD family protein [Edaphobacter sp.]|jgi:uncharacterized RDD family membrane protein YckC|nr:RDD family protein [Edaphobacter sp.]
MSAAQRDLLPLDEPIAETGAIPSALREEAAQRLAAHRARKTQRSGNSISSASNPSSVNTRTARIAAAVAERYAQSQSYRAFLAEQAEAAIREAQATAEIAVLNAQAVADAQNQLLAELDQWSLTPSIPSVATALHDELRITEAAASAEANVPTPGLTVRLYDQDQVDPPRPKDPQVQTTSNRTFPPVFLDENEALVLDEEIAFRQAPVFEDALPVDIPANLIEFPRQLVAPRKARPRLAEGPLREDVDKSARENPDTAQLRIFEVEPSQLSSAPAVESAAPEWSSILLTAQPVSTAIQEVPEAPFQPILSPQTAPFSLRLMAAIVDGCIVATALLAFLTVVALTVGKLSADHKVVSASVPMTTQAAAITIGATFFVLTLLYQFLFFSFSEATPGMRYAKIALCTLSDDNPTRVAMRRRILASVLAACPFGIGFLWAWLDDDGLGWHDRISRMYQRSY